MTIQITVVETTRFNDQKKTLWPFALAWLLMPVIGCRLAVTTGSEIFYWLVPVIWFVVVPIFDLVLPRDNGDRSYLAADGLD